MSPSAQFFYSSGSPDEPRIAAGQRFHVVRTCQELGVCHCPTPTCQSNDNTPHSSPWDQIAYYTAVALSCALSAVCVIGTAGYLYSRFFGA